MTYLEPLLLRFRCMSSSIDTSDAGLCEEEHGQPYREMKLIRTFKQSRRALIMREAGGDSFKSVLYHPSLANQCHPKVTKQQELILAAVLLYNLFKVAPPSEAS